jgi:hypothetical protein
MCSKESQIMKWLIDNKLYTHVKDKEDLRVASHTLYNGGVVYLPESKTSEYEYKFLSHYAKDLANGVDLHFIEQRPAPESPAKGIYKYMVDLDIYDDYYLSDKEFIELGQIITNVVNQFYAESSYDAILCKSAPKMKNGRTHSGLHMIFPKLFVNNEIAKMFRSAVIQQFEQLKIRAGQDWATQFDILIYEGVGYTMVGSSKLEKPRRVYMPFIIIDKNGNSLDAYLNRLLQNPLDLMLDTSIRYIPDNVKHDTFDGCRPTKVPEWFKENEHLVRPVMRRKSNSVKCIGVDKDYVYKIIIDTLRKAPKVWSHNNYSDVTIKTIQRYPDASGPNCGNLLIVVNSKYCMNLGREHNSCGIYFHANRKGICQKCLCPCNNLQGRKNGLCSGYTSSYIPFPEEFLEVLFDKRLKFEKVKFRDEHDKCEDKCDTKCEETSSVKCNNTKCEHMCEETCDVDCNDFQEEFEESTSEETAVFREDTESANTPTKVEKPARKNTAKAPKEPKEPKKAKEQKTANAPKETKEPKAPKIIKPKIGKYQPGMTGKQIATTNYQKNVGKLLKRALEIQ